MLAYAEIAYERRLLCMFVYILYYYRQLYMLQIVK